MISALAEVSSEEGAALVASVAEVSVAAVDVDSVSDPCADGSDVLVSDAEVSGGVVVSGGTVVSIVLSAVSAGVDSAVVSD